MMQSWTPPKTLSGRPVAVIGAGVLGRRIGTLLVWHFRGALTNTINQAVYGLREASMS
jgi:hypothetical protein